MLTTIFTEILKASHNNQTSIFAFTFKFKYYIIGISYYNDIIIYCNCIVFYYTILFFSTKQDVVTACYSEIYFIILCHTIILYCITIILLRADDDIHRNIESFS